MNKKNILLAMVLFLSGIVSGQNYTNIINDYLSKNLEKYDLLESDIKEWKITSQSYSEKTNIRHIYIQQLYKGIPVFNAVSNISIRESDNEVIFIGNSFVKNLTSKINTTTPVLKPVMAISQTASALHLGDLKNIELLEEKENNKFIFSKSGISQEKIPVELVYQPLEDGSVKLSWLLNIYQLDGIHWWNVRVDANTGVILDKNDWGVSCNFDITTGTHAHGSKIIKQPIQSPVIAIKKNLNFFEVAQYNVFALPVESPNHGARSLLTAPHNTLASPFGWHDTDGAVGPEFTTTRGNNVYAQLDDDNDDETLGYSPDGGSELNFNFSLELTNNPADSYKDVSVTNLFYLNNVMHDIWYQYGFDEVSGNFQSNNYGREAPLTFPPTDGDEVIADAQDAGGKNNANFRTPPDGTAPRMQMYLWDDASMSINTGSLTGNYSISDSRFTIDGTSDTARSGAPLNENPITADLALMNDDSENPLLGCSETGEPIAGLDGKIVVIRRGECGFVNKVKLAQDNNAVGVIVVNNTGGAFSMGGATQNITIPAVSIPLELGNSIISALSNAETINVSLTAFDLDGSFDNGIIAHEYGHGISNRLIGGGNNTNCMSNQEQLGEGWSDYFGIAITMKPGDTETKVRGVGTFASGQATTGSGIRRYPYTTNMAVNPFTFNNVKDQSLGDGNVSVHGVGSIWATMLWDLQWKMINIYGFDSDMYNGTGGNNKTMALVIEGLKLTPCNSGFVGARDAILAADEILYDGIHQCAIWEVFARRGLGYSASSGDPNSYTDQVEAFDMPPAEVLPPSACNALNLNSESLDIFKVYPNPANTSVNISFSNQILDAKISIYDINGRRVFYKETNVDGVETLNVGKLSAGIFILELTKGDLKFRKKLIIN